MYHWLAKIPPKISWSRQHRITPAQRDELAQVLASGYYVILTGSSSHLSSVIVSLLTWCKTGHWGRYSHVLMNADNIENPAERDDFKFVEATAQGVAYATFNEVNHTIIKGYVKATGLFKTLYQFREEGQVIVFDDADAIFYDDVALNLLKASCDTTDRRRVSWRSEAKFVDEDTAEIIPSSFDFNGTIIFITNLDMDGMVDRGHKLAPHLEALISRAHYIDLSLKTRRDYLIRIRQVIEEGMLNSLTIEQKVDVLTFIEVHADSLRELSLRMAIKIANLRRANPDWERLARVTCLR